MGEEDKVRHRCSGRDRGFTLIEVLVVVLVVGVLAAIAVPVFLNHRKRAVDASLRADLRQAALVLETWTSENPSVPVPTETVYGPGHPATSTSPLVALAGFRGSPMNAMQVQPGSAGVGSYTLCAWSPRAVWATGPLYAFRYDPAAGGMIGTRSTDVGAC